MSCHVRGGGRFVDKIRVAHSAFSFGSWDSRVDTWIRWVRFKESSLGEKLNLARVRMHVVELMMLGTFGEQGKEVDGWMDRTVSLTSCITRGKRARYATEDCKRGVELEYVMGYLPIILFE